MTAMAFSSLSSNEAVGEGGHRAAVTAQIGRARCDRPKLSTSAPAPSTGKKKVDSILK